MNGGRLPFAHIWTAPPSVDLFKRKKGSLTQKTKLKSMSKVFMQAIAATVCSLFPISDVPLAGSRSGSDSDTPQDASHTINILKSPTAPLAKKRQIMINTFGDYRAKMAEEENQFRKGNIQMRFNTLSPSKKSSFVKKSTSIIKKRFEPSNNGFNFNFSDISPSEKVVEDVSVLNCTTTGEATDKLASFFRFHKVKDLLKLFVVQSKLRVMHVCECSMRQDGSDVFRDTATCVRLAAHYQGVSPAKSDKAPEQ
uniref:Uncharacterized protein n=1 Tax=Timema tahoe TaxID=61484 RepID=A0A7R9FMV1_9NEOP|nr:unnamed protein product [Timema tahoe]